MSSTAVSATSASRPIRVMVVDDAVVVRGLVSRWLSERGMDVVASHRHGKLAVDDLEHADPDVVVLDIEMPEMDGLTALPLMLKKKPDLAVIMASTLTRRNAEISMKCMGMGAQDYVPKPETNRDVTVSPEFREELVRKVQALGERRARQAGRSVISVSEKSNDAAKAAVISSPSAIKLRSFGHTTPKVLAIGSSTGGPQALAVLIKGLQPVLSKYPVLITQHMPATFTAILAEHLTKIAGFPAREGVDGEPVVAGRLYVAPGGRHMVVERSEAGPVIRLQDGPAVNFCKPAVDPMLQSLAAVYGGAVCSIILTGMGADGAHGVEVVTAAGGTALAQDEATSVVWGMPGAAAHTGQCSAVLPLDDIAPRVLRFLSGDRS